MKDIESEVALALQLLVNQLDTEDPKDWEYIEKVLTKTCTNLLETQALALEGRKDNKLFGFSVIVSEDPNPSDDYDKGFLAGFNEANRQAADHLRAQKITE